MKIAIVHDYLKEYGGAERVLKVLHEMYPEAPIYTAFSVKNSAAEKGFRGAKIVESWLAPLLKTGKLYSPLRFLTPWIWGSFDLSKYDLVITSCSWYITRGFKIGKNTKVVAYCHTPPRWLYGYGTSVSFQKYWPVKLYALIVGHFLRMYDWNTAQSINHWIANSKNIAARINKFYRKDSVVIYPPIEVENIILETKDLKKEDYFLIVSRLVGAKGIEEAIKAFQSEALSKYKLKIVGEGAGFSDLEQRIANMEYKNIELVGRVDDKELWELYAKSKGFIALSKDEDFGMTVVEAQAAGTPVVAFNGGGYRESIIDPSTVRSGQVATGIFINSTDKKTITSAIKKLGSKGWDKELIQENAKRFSKERFVKEFKKFVANRV
ncbi:hypothetical protein A2159_02720 [Candidatus Woesebacteria bacterium RBG_13_34_9]|uniref:Glycosyl transferase family 1 domain-containing protein n=1 Tax=Candidatus Woesebacteria bacterium RBG_13_34_9 TaxID=1802477 RepID=A0A1F7X2G4_9BACT|nr:MAG: hypothetical protein A2159_02720 [Candidatus Woesebacteria bacterium RBG_13_34_9]